MSSREQWQRIKAIFNSAKECAPAARPDYLNEACGNDELIRREVETLLAADESNDDFLHAPAYEFAAGMLAEDKSEFAAGQSVGPYTILSLLGSGGMGEVYLAQDTRLGRRIALKLIASEFASDARRVYRFEQEARAASALNHPNVCVIHEIGTTESGRHFIAMEHIDGVTLRARIARRRLKPGEALDVIIQIADALIATHAAGIIHCDIKPENIMLRRDGYIKVLDFGLAKLNENLPRQQQFHEASTIKVRTESGMLMGTVRYMSPEQLREAQVDERTDIWSLCVVLHEMVTGTTPFEAPTTNDTIAMILERQSRELDFSDEIPPKLQQIIKKALVKDRAERYQTVRELASDLKRLRREMRSRSEILAAAPDLMTQLTLSVPLRGGQESTVSGTERGSAIFVRMKSRAISTADFLFSEIKEHKTAAVFTGVTAILAALLLVPNLPRLVGRFYGPTGEHQKSTEPLQTMKMASLTNSGTSVCAAISPDGNLVAHAEYKDGMQQLLLTSIATSGSSILVSPADVKYLGVTFSRDGNYLYFTRSEHSDAGVLYQLALPGSPPRKIKDGVDSPITFSPAGDRFSFVRVNKSNGEFSLMQAAIDGSGEQTLASRGNGQRLSVYGPAWSPNGKTIVCAAGWWDKGYHMNLIEVGVEDRHEKVLTGGSWYSVLQVAWLEDQSGLVVSANEQALSPYQLWRVSYPQGEPIRITNDTSEYKSVSLSRDGNSIAPVRSQQVGRIWVAADGDAQRARAIASTAGRIYGLDWTTDGKIVFSAMTQDKLNISSIDPDGSNQNQLTVNAGDNYSPAVSPDGRYIVFASNRTGSLNIWRMNAGDGSEPRQLTFSDGNSYPSCSADSRWVVYDNLTNSKTSVWKVSIDGDDPVQLTDENARMPIVSPDNQFIAYRYSIEAAEGIAILPFQGGPPVKRVPIPIMDWQRVQWVANGHALTYIDTTNGVSNIWSYDLESGSSKKLTEFTADKIFAYAWSPNQKQLACERGMEPRDVTVISNWR